MFVILLAMASCGGGISSQGASNLSSGEQQQVTSYPNIDGTSYGGTMPAGLGGGSNLPYCAEIQQSLDGITADEPDASFTGHFAQDSTGAWALVADIFIYTEESIIALPCTVTSTDFASVLNLSCHVPTILTAYISDFSVSLNNEPNGCGDYIENYYSNVVLTACNPSLTNRFNDRKKLKITYYYGGADAYADDNGNKDGLFGAPGFPGSLSGGEIASVGRVPVGDGTSYCSMSATNASATFLCYDAAPKGNQICPAVYSQ